MEILDFSFWTRVGVALLCGFIIGAERQVRGKPVGIRTSILICLGTMLFVYLGITIGSGGDPTRVLGQVVTGVGFLGAGVIMTRNGLVSGVTSASIVWLLAGIGAAVGLEHYSVAVAISVVGLIVLLGVQGLEDVFHTILQRGVHRHKKED